MDAICCVLLLGFSVWMLPAMDIATADQSLVAGGTDNQWYCNMTNAVCSAHSENDTRENCALKCKNGTGPDEACDEDGGGEGCGDYCTNNKDDGCIYP